MKFNSRSTTRVTNMAGASAFSQSSKVELLGIMLTSFLKDSFYENEDKTLIRLEAVCRSIEDKEFLAKAAVYARTVFGMRSVSHVVAVHIARETKGMKGFFDKVIHRPDDMVEIAAYFMHKYKTTLPNAMKKGFALALQRFSEYTLAKYKCDRKNVSMVDIVNIVHPKPTKAIDKLVNGTLKSTETWEAQLSVSLQSVKTNQEKDDIKKTVWSNLVRERKLGYFALLRNLRNIIQCAPEMESLVAEQIRNAEAIKKSLVLPFRFTTAIEAVKGSSSRVISEAVSDALDVCLSNVPELPGKTLIVLDGSGSMETVGDKAALFAASLYKANKSSDFMIFSNEASYVTIDSRMPVSMLYQALMQNLDGGGTDFNAIFDRADKPYDNIVILSDMQAWMSGNYFCSVPTQALNSYKQRTGASPRIFSFDLAGYGSLQFPEPEVYALAGISEKTFDIMKMLCEDKQALLKIVDSVNLSY